VAPQDTPRGRAFPLAEICAALHPQLTRYGTANIAGRDDGNNPPILRLYEFVLHDVHVSVIGFGRLWTVRSIMSPGELAGTAPLRVAAKQIANDQVGSGRWDKALLACGSRLNKSRMIKWAAGGGTKRCWPAGRG
jgi:hypothetical protein